MAAVVVKAHAQSKQKAGAKVESGVEQEEGKRGGGLLGTLGRMAAGQSPSPPGEVLTIQGAIEIKSLDKEAGDFEIPASYRRR